MRVKEILGFADRKRIGKLSVFLVSFLPSMRRRKIFRFFLYHLPDLVTSKKKICTLTLFACPMYYMLYAYFPNTNCFIIVGLSVTIM